MKDQPIQTAIIGAGAIAREHIGCLRQLPRVRIAGICDLSPAVAESMAERFGLERWFTDHTRMIAEVRPDIVHITTPPASHFPLAMDALEGGSHVFVEKPITRTLEELATLQQRAAVLGRHVVEDHNYLYNRSVRHLLNLVRQNRFGEVVHVDVSLCLDLMNPGNRYMDRNAPHPCLDMPGGAVADFVTHMAALTWAFVGCHRHVTSVWSKTTDSPLPLEDLRALVEAKRGTASLAFSARAQPDMFRVRLEGTKMRAEADLFEPRFTVEQLHRGPRPLIPLRNGLARAGAESAAAVGGLWRKLRGGPGVYEGLWVLIAKVYEALREGSPLPISDTQVRGVNELAAELSRHASSTEFACKR